MNAKASSLTIGVLTSGGDAPGMNAALRAVVRTAINRGVNVYAIYEGYRGMVEGGSRIRRVNWDSVGGILHQGGTIIGSARSPAFRERAGRLKAAKNLLEYGIDRLIVIGGDGSLTGGNIFRNEWASLLAELVETGEISQELADKHPYLSLTGLVGSIDNDMFGTDMTIGADTALHRITEAVDAITSTASSHQRSFVIEVMGRNCGYLALMSAIATGANWVFIPEFPPETDDWEQEMCDMLYTGREQGRRASIVIVAEGARDRSGKPITSDHVKRVLEERIGEDTRVTVLGHVQRGGAPSAFERYMSTMVGYSAVIEALAAKPGREPQVIGIREHRVVRSPLAESIKKTHQVAEYIKQHNFAEAMRLRGGSFTEAYDTLKILTRAQPKPLPPGQKPLRLALLHSGGPAPGMNTAARVAVRLALHEGHKLLAFQGGFEGILEDAVREMDWMSVTGWVARGGAELGISRYTPSDEDLPLLAEKFAAYEIDGLLMVGGWSGYETVHKLYNHRDEFPAFNVPMICLPTSINNNLPGSEHSIGADTALNNIITCVDKIKESAVASGRCFIVEVMGRDCGYLALMSGIATGAERVYLPEEGVTLSDLQENVSALIESFKLGKRLGLIIRNENVDRLYTTDFMRALLEKESGDMFDVRTAILGHIQQGGNPSPYDRIQATRLAANSINFLISEVDKPSPAAVFIGLQGGRVAYTSVEQFAALVDKDYQRPRGQWWLDLRTVADSMANLRSIINGNGRNGKNGPSNTE